MSKFTHDDDFSMLDPAKEHLPPGPTYKRLLLSPNPVRGDQTGSSVCEASVKTEPDLSDVTSQLANLRSPNLKPLGSEGVWGVLKRAQENGVNAEEALLECNEENVLPFYGRIEICQKLTSAATADALRIRVTGELLTTRLAAQLGRTDLTIDKFEDRFLSDNVDYVAVRDTRCHTATAWGAQNQTKEECKAVLSRMDMHVHHLHEGPPATHSLPGEGGDGAGGEVEELPAANYWCLPSAELKDLWENLVYEDNVKDNLLQYARTTLLFSDCKVNSSIISWNRLVLLHGPPGTGKTSLCKALAQKLSIVLSDRYTHGQLIEINSHSLFSKWFSESGKLVMKMFKEIQTFVCDPDALVCVLIDEVESLSASRQSMSCNEPSDAIRVVNALLTQLDLIKRHPNVIILTTSNITGAIDSAFLDRADIRQYIGLPSPPGIYEIYHSCILELIRAGIVIGADSLPDRRIFERLSTNGASPSTPCVASATGLRLGSIAEASVGLSGRTLRKLPFIAHALFIQTPTVTLSRFLSALSLAVSRHFRDGKALSGPLTS